MYSAAMRKLLTSALLLFALVVCLFGPVIAFARDGAIVCRAEALR